MQCGLGLDCHGVGVMFINTCSLLLCFHPKPPFVMLDGNVIFNPKFAGFQVVLELCLIFLLHFPIMLHS